MQRNFIKQCKVCGAKEKICFHYGVCTCRACGAFFRYFLFCSIWKNFFLKDVLLKMKENANINVNVRKRIKTGNPKQIWQNVKNVDLINVFLLE